MKGSRPDTIFITKCVDSGNKGHEVVRYSVCREDCECVINDISYDQLKELVDYLYEYMKHEKGGVHE